MRLIIVLFLLPLLSWSQQSLDSHSIQELIDSKKYSEAKTILKHQLDKQPKDLVAIEFLGDVYSKEKEWDKAIEHYLILVEHNSESANYQYKYGGALGMKAKSVNKFRAIGYLDDVEEAFLKAVELDPKHSDAHWALALYYMHVPGILGGSKKKAMYYADRLEALSKVDGYLAKGHLHEDDKEFELAENYYQKAVEVGGSVTCFTHLADLYLNTEDYSKAVKTLEIGYTKLKDKQILDKLKSISKEHNIYSSLVTP